LNELKAHNFNETEEIKTYNSDQGFVNPKNTSENKTDKDSNNIEKFTKLIEELKELPKRNSEQNKLLNKYRANLHYYTKIKNK
jgi:hypothetical protein